MKNSICQRIMLSLLAPHRSMTVPELSRETGVAARALLPVLNRLIGSGAVVVRENRVKRLTLEGI